MRRGELPFRNFPNPIWRQGNGYTFYFWHTMGKKGFYGGPKQRSAAPVHKLLGHGPAHSESLAPGGNDQEWHCSKFAVYEWVEAQLFESGHQFFNGLEECP
jgi:hypothetical protein